MGKRGNGEGTVYEHKRNGKKVGYRGAYIVHTAKGPKRRYVGGKTREEVRRKLVKAMADRDGGLVFDAGSLTVGEYLDRWLSDCVKGTVRESTFERYGYVVRPHIKPTLGQIKLKSLTTAHVRGFYREKLDAGLSPATVHKMHVVLHKALDQAVADGMISRNVTDALKLPRIDREEINPLTAEEANRLIEAARGDRLEALYVLAVHSGLRQGELLALRWEDLDLEARTLRVRRTLTWAGGKHSLTEPKTKKSRRTVRLTTGAVAALRDHLKRQLSEMDRLGSLYQNGNLVFANEIGGIVNPSNLRNRSFAKLLERAGLNGVRFHDLRHTCATLLLSKNVNPKIVSEMLGHANIAITLDTYSHVLPDMQEKAARAIEEALRS
ncbi:MAG: site-specific integrase [Actinobacteria bacterium]|nr:MAG: site-specific integrase [Actinomycetota bacterium]